MRDGVRDRRAQTRRRQGAPGRSGLRLLDVLLLLVTAAASHRTADRDSSHSVNFLLLFITSLPAAARDGELYEGSPTWTKLDYCCRRSSALVGTYYFKLIDVMTSVWKRLQRVGKKASKFQFVASYQELLLECTKKW